MPAASIQTPAEQLAAIHSPTDRLSVTASDELAIDGHRASDLLRRYGSPLFVCSETTLRDNYHRIRGAFVNSWPATVNIMYAIKANPNLAIRAVLDQVGAGGDCFSEGELFATFEAGANPELIALNGGCKTADSLRIAVERGILINIDAESEIDQLLSICQLLGKPAKVCIRVKPESDEYDHVATDYFGGEHLADYVRRAKWGFTIKAACNLIQRIRSTSNLKLIGLSSHIGRASRDTAFYEHYGRAVGHFVVSIFEQTGFAAKVLDIGGGWPRERDPESRSRSLNTTPVEKYVQASCDAILSQLQGVGVDIPSLWAEPGRFIVGNASALLATVGTIKHDLGLTWVNIDAGTNDLPRIDTSGSAYHVLAATGMNRPADQIVDVVGPTCIDSLMGRDVAMPKLQVGDAIAILDAGMYSEAASTQFNSLPRPATVLVNESSTDIIKERETVDDVFMKHRIPARLRRNPQ